MSSTKVQRVPLPSKLPHTLAPNFRYRLEKSLFEAPSHPIRRLQSTLTESLKASGWGNHLQSFVYDRLRENNGVGGSSSSGKRRREEDDELDHHPRKRQRSLFTSKRMLEQRNEILKDVKSASRPQSKRVENGKYVAKRSALQTNGEQSSVVQGKRENIRMPPHVIEAAVRMIRDELDKICDIDDDAYLDLRLT